ncbi:hypothetical protein [Methylotenera sp.]|uniref:hypothetical protein n=1 Tax=Methylotenera sp. TaxID=2051956 RepID=UPI0027310B56|nr:hypothetical protein [Methylotenera sp.]MDP2229626.1 hypothetical protein [Methylotenera sp.]
MRSERIKLMFASINIKTMVVMLVTGVIAAFTGLIASTGNPILLALLVGMFAGVALLKAPNVSVWMLLIIGLFSGFLGSLVPGLSKLPWALALLSMLLLLPVSIKFIENQRIPFFIWLAMIFMIYAVLATLVQMNSLSELFAGFKRYFQMYGLMFALALLAFKPEDYKRWLKLMMIIALMQLPFSLFEYFVLVGMRGGRGVGGAEATDVVAGTFGANLEGGSANSVMVAFLIMGMAFFIARWKEGLIEKKRVVWLCLLCLLPLGLGETKIVIFLLPMVWLVVMRDDIKQKSGRFLLQFVGLLIVTSIFALVYLGLNTGASSLTSSDVLKEALSSNIGSKGYGTYILNRTTVISFWWENHHLSDLVTLLFGHGLGSSYFSPTNPIAGHVAVQYIGYGIDLTTATSILWDTGLIGLLLFLIIFIAAWVSAGRLRAIASSAHIRADALAIQACIALFIVFTFYDSTLINFLPFELITATVLGYLGYLMRNQYVVTFQA